MKETTGLYKSYLLRIWRDSLEGEWRASLQDVVTCESRNFPSVASLLEYITLETRTRTTTLRIQQGEVLMQKT